MRRCTGSDPASALKARCRGPCAPSNVTTSSTSNAAFAQTQDTAALRNGQRPPGAERRHPSHSSVPPATPGEPRRRDVPNADHGLIESIETADGTTKTYSAHLFDVTADWIDDRKLPAAGKFIVMPTADGASQTDSPPVNR